MASKTNNQIDPLDLRKAFSQFPTGVTVVTTIESNGIARGFTANSFTSVSLDPPLLLVCIDKRAVSLPVFLQGRGFAINILGQDQKDISGLFATQQPDKFDIAKWHLGANGLPLLDDTVAWFECDLENQVDAGDHVIIIGYIKDYGYRNGQPLGYVGGGYFTLGLEQSIVDVASKSEGVRIGALLQQNGTLLLQEHTDVNKVSIPMVGGNKTQPSLANLMTMLSGEHLSLTIDFLFAVYEDLSSGVHVVCYRGDATGQAPEGMTFYLFEDIPWDRMIDEATASMLQRYMEEYKYGKFAIYMGDDMEGKLRILESKVKDKKLS